MVDASGTSWKKLFLKKILSAKVFDLFYLIVGADNKTLARIVFVLPRLSAWLQAKQEIACWARLLDAYLDSIDSLMRNKSNKSGSAMIWYDTNCECN